MDPLVKTFLELADIDETYPNENKVLAYIEKRLTNTETSYERDETGNIVATIKGASDEWVGLCGHVDIAAPLLGRKVIVEDDIIKTDGVALLGGDDKTAVAAMLELAAELHASGLVPSKNIELIFTVGEEAGLHGAKALDISKLNTKRVMVFDWSGAVNNIITKSPAYYKVDVEYLGKDAHPALWQQGVNAGASLMKAASQLRQGDYNDNVIFNIGIVNVGNARNKIPGQATLSAEVRSFDNQAAKDAAEEIGRHFESVAKESGVQPKVRLEAESESFKLNDHSGLYQAVVATLKDMGLEPKLEQTYGCFDGNIFDSKGLEVVTMGAAYYNPHSPDESVNVTELKGLYGFIKAMATGHSDK